MSASEPAARHEPSASGPDGLLPPEMAGRAEEVGARKAALELPRLFTLAVLAGAFVALGGVFATTALAGTDGAPWGPVWLSYSARTTTDRILAVVPPISAFVAAGFEHSIANMYFVPYAMVVAALDPELVAARGLGPRAEALTWLAFLGRNLLPVTIGTVIGGSVLLGAVYWFVYLRPHSLR